MNEVSDEGRMWAAISYVGLFAYLPLGLIPLIWRNDAYALQHGKYAMAAWVGWLVASIVGGVAALAISFVTCGLMGFVTIPLLMLVGLWPWATAIHGLLLVYNKDWSEPIGSFGLHDQLFQSVQLEDQSTPPQV